MNSGLIDLSESIKKSIDYESVKGRKNIIRKSGEIIKGKERAQIGSSKSIVGHLDNMPLVDRSLVDYKKYHKYVGHAGRKYSMSMQATRGCPYKCFYCDIWCINPAALKR